MRRLGMANIWKCPKCGRYFGKRDQRHSCTVYPVENHLKGKDFARSLYEMLKEKVRKKAGDFKVESLPCCIHFVKPSNAFTFAAVYALRDRIRVHFGLNREVRSPRIGKSAKVSANKYMYSIDIKNAKEIDAELLFWMKGAYNLKDK